jgi:hypothetical protein
LRGQPQTYQLSADSGNTVTSAFCSRCGSPVFKTSSGYPDIIFFHAATLDDPSSYKPQTVVWITSKQPWDHVDPAIPVHA